MKNKRFVFIPFLLAALITGFLAGAQVRPALAQTQCVDAAGGPIPCPADDGGNNNNDGGNKRSTRTPVPPTATPTNTPLPISAAPTSLPDENYLGSCSNADGNVFDCFEKFKCEDGLLVMKVDLYTGNGTKYDFYCIPDETVPQLNLPLSIPDPVGKDANWTGDCPADGLEACLDLASADCTQEGGEISIWYDPEGGAGVYCENQSEAGQPAPEPTALPLAVAPSGGDTSGEDWDESCSWASCFAYDLMCWADGGSGYGQEDGAGNTVYHCDMPEGSTSGNNLKQLGIAIILVVIAVIAIPALIRARRSATAESSGHIKKATLFMRKAGDDSGDDAPPPPPPPPPPPAK